MISDQDYTIPGYEILERIDETRRSFVFRARKGDNAETVVIKTLKVNNPTTAEMARLKQDCDLV